MTITETEQIQLNECCGIRSYRPLGKGPHTCTVCLHEIDSPHPYEPFVLDLTPKRPEGSA